MTVDNRENRPVKLHTDFGEVDGDLRCSPVVRTLDELNVISRVFVTVETAKVAGTPGDGPLAVNKDAIAFVVELPRKFQPASAPMRPQSVSYKKAPVELRVGSYTVRGCFHVPPGARAMTRLTHQGHTFLALTGVSWDGPEGSGSAPFVAVNREKILAARECGAADGDRAQARTGAAQTV